MAKNNTDILFKTAGITVRKFRSTDADAVRRAANFSSVARMTGHLPHPYYLRDATEYIRTCRQRYRRPNATKRNYAIVCDDTVIGAIGATRHGDEAEIGYWLTPAYWRRGIMTGVVRQFSKLVLTWWPVHRLVAKMFPHNPASARVVEKSGFRRSAYQLRVVKKGRRWFDAIVYTRDR